MSLIQTDFARGTNLRQAIMTRRERDSRPSIPHVTPDGSLRIAPVIRTPNVRAVPPVSPKAREILASHDDIYCQGMVPWYSRLWLNIFGARSKAGTTVKHVAGTLYRVQAQGAEPAFVRFYWL